MYDPAAGKMILTVSIASDRYLGICCYTGTVKYTFKIFDGSSGSTQYP